MIDSDSAYFAQRASEERTAATRATSDAARALHLELAGRYEDLSISIVAQMAPVMTVAQPANDLDSPAIAQSTFSHERPRLTIVAGTRVTA